MRTVGDFLKDLESINLEQLTADIIDSNKSEIAAIQRKQLMKGRGADGNILRPLISEDPFFKTPESAAAYARWKSKITPETPFNVANLYIVGVYHRSIDLNATVKSIRFLASASFANSITAKYRDNALGLNKESRKDAYVKVIRDPLIKSIKNTTGAR